MYHSNKAGSILLAEAVAALIAFSSLAVASGSLNSNPAKALKKIVNEATVAIDNYAHDLQRLPVKFGD